MQSGSNQYLALEHYRLHVIEQWPNGPRKKASLAAARSTVESLNRIHCQGTLFECITCARKDVDADQCPPGDG
jgi:hypothetical protein